MIKTWIEVLSTGNLPDGKRMDLVSKWLIVTRAFSFLLSLTSVTIGGLLAAIDGFFHPLTWILTLVGVVLAQAASNMLNDLYDTRQGIDANDYPRLKYAPHPLVNGLVSLRGLIVAVVLCILPGAVIALYLIHRQGWEVGIFVAAGILVSFGYVAPPVKLKQRGLGELVQILAWGPVITGGTYYVVTGQLPLKVWVASLPFGIAVATALMAKYIDRVEIDRTRWILTLPVLLGERRAKRLAQILVWTFYLLVTGLVAAGWLPWAALLVLLSLPRAGRFLAALYKPFPENEGEAFLQAEGVFSEYVRIKTAPETPLRNSLIGSFWYMTWGDWWRRLVGVLFVVGLFFGVVEKELSSLL